MARVFSRLRTATTDRSRPLSLQRNVITSARIAPTLAISVALFAAILTPRS
jgi:hypothetical protein